MTINNRLPKLDVSTASDLTNGVEGEFITLSVDISGFCIRRTLRTAEVSVDGKNVQANDIVKLPGIDVIPNSAVTFVSKSRDRIKANLMKVGFHFGKGEYLIPLSDVQEAYSDLLELERWFWKQVDEFAENYLDYVDEQKLLAPKYAEQIDKSMPSLETAIGSFKFSISSPRSVSVNNTAVELIKDIVGDRTDLLDATSSLTSNLIESISSEVKHCWRYSFRSFREKHAMNDNGGKTQSGVIQTLAKIKDKVNSVICVEPRFSKVIDVINAAVSILPKGWNTPVGEFIKDQAHLLHLVHTIESLTQPSWIANIVEGVDPLEIIAAIRAGTISSDFEASAPSNSFVTLDNTDIFELLAVTGEQSSSSVHNDLDAMFSQLEVEISQSSDENIIEVKTKLDNKSAINNAIVSDDKTLQDSTNLVSGELRAFTEDQISIDSLFSSL
ncbi:DUF3150 domain-containing protein (plasmid) [Aliivibrio salmonicida]|uniref:DUF3150 domain-containing protein n=1 Tax=Aliivibrio salmonicida TaxID=40269 RepID=UPI000F6F7D3F|nr:DUF3150 domain-containing protein [Aliivibrio salmonicida]AZL83454.1 DUF3150 domain-containing protein [Aliivibrio salmonicida]